MRKTKRQIEDEKDYGGRSLFDLIELEFSQGEENEQQNGKSSQHREITNNAKRTSISSNTPSVDRQENSAIQLDNTREMGGALSQHNQESGNVGFNDISIATNTNGTSNLREQRSGRVIRQGNELFMRDPQNFRVKEFRYATARTYDARMWQVIESKARSIEQFRKAGADLRTLEDITSGAADAAEMKAEATGNPLILLQVQLNSDLRQEEMLYSGYKRQIHNNEESLKAHLSKIELLQKDIVKMEILNSIIKENNNEHFQGKYYINDDNNISTKDFIIFKDDTSDLNKARQAELTKNFENTIQMIANDYQQEYKVLEYKGLIISGERTDLNTLSFYVLTSDGKTIIEPENMIYKRDDKTFFKLENYVNFGGFIKRLNHFYNDLEKFTQFNKTKIENLEKEILELKSITGDNTPKYKRKDYLEALREDNRIVMEEIEKMSKQKNYKSAFVPKSARILEELDKQNKIVKENMIDFK